MYCTKISRSRCLAGYRYESKALRSFTFRIHKHAFSYSNGPRALATLHICQCCAMLLCNYTVQLTRNVQVIHNCIIYSGISDIYVHMYMQRFMYGISGGTLLSF